MALNKKLILKMGLLFVCALLLLTFLSNTIYNFNLPNVTVAYPETAAIVRSATGRGTVEFASETAFFASASGSIYPLVEAGQQVKAGDALYVLVEDVSRLKEALAELLLQREVLALRAAQDQSEVDHAAGGIGRPDELNPFFDDDLAKLELAIESAQAELEAYRKHCEEQKAYQDAMAEQALDSLYQEYRAQRSELEDEEDLKQLRAAYERDRDRLEVEQAMAAEAFAFQTEQELATRQTALTNLQLEYRQTYAQKQKELASQSQNLSGLQHQSELTQLEIRENEQKISLLQQQIAGEGRITVTAEKEGLVSWFDSALENGALVGQGQHILSIGVPEAGYRTTIALPENVDYLSVGDGVKVNVVGREPHHFDGWVRKLSNENGMLLAEVRFSAEGLLGGESAEMTVQKSSELFDTVLPNSALREDSDGEYILYVEKVPGFWRDTYYARRMFIAVREQNAYQAGVMIPDGARLPTIINTDTAVNDGDKVRIVGWSDLLEIR